MEVPFKSSGIRLDWSRQKYLQCNSKYDSETDFTMLSEIYILRLVNIGLLFTTLYIPYILHLEQVSLNPLGFVSEQEYVKLPYWTILFGGGMTSG